MAFQRPSKPPQFADLKGILAQSKETDNPLYQVVQEILERLTQLKLVTINENTIKNIIAPGLPEPPVVIPPEDLPPGAHAITHQPGGSDPMQVDAVPTVGSLRTLGTGPNQAAPGNDVRFTDPITPLPHGATHNTGSSDPITAIAESIITDGAILARVAAAETITGQWRFVSTITSFEAAGPQLVIKDTAAPTDEKYWRLFVSGGDFAIQALTDAFGSGPYSMYFSRNGVNPDAVFLYTNGVVRTSWDSLGTLHQQFGLRLSGRSNASISGDQTAWNPTGLGTVFTIIAGATVNVTIRGILAQADGYIVHIFLSNANMTFTHDDAAASTANRIFAPGLASFTLTTFQSVTLKYDATYTRWIVIGWVK